MTNKNIKNIKEISKLFPFLYASIVSDNEDLIDDENISEIKAMADRILRSLEFDKQLEEEYRMDLIQVIAELSSSNLILFDDPNYEWSEHFITEFFSGNIYEISKTNDDLKILVINSLSLAIKEYLNFHSSLFFNDQISLATMKQLNKNTLNRSTIILIETLHYINKNLGSDFLKEHVKMSGRVYAYALSGLFNALTNNPTRVVDYIKKQDKFLKNVEEMFLDNYSSLVVKGDLIINKIEN
jgi:hypothetical protein